MYSTYNPSFKSLNLLGYMATRPEGFEPPTCGFVGLSVSYPGFLSCSLMTDGV